ncbi:TPA: DUF3147 family protein [Candidatus Micrarchaeota archaeon]|nr:DUF3147 family protein [Candidatus Micrarchaeota archaeon]
MDLFLVKLVLSFIVGGSFLAFTLWISEKFGSKIGGIIIGLPSTTLVSLLFIAWTQDASVAVSAAVIIPAITAVSLIFSYAFVMLYKGKLGMTKALAGALLVWGFLTLPLVLLKISDLSTSLIFSALFFIAGIVLLKKFPHRKLEKFSFSKKVFLYRVGFAGLVVVTSVSLGKFLGPLYGGLFASFPSGAFSTMFLITEKHGVDFAASIARSMSFGNICNAVFAVAFYLIVPAQGIILGTIAAYAIALVSAIVIYKTTVAQAS